MQCFSTLFVLQIKRLTINDDVLKFGVLDHLLLITFWWPPPCFWHDFIYDQPLNQCFWNSVPRHTNQSFLNCVSQNFKYIQFVCNFFMMKCAAKLYRSFKCFVSQKSLRTTELVCRQRAPSCRETFQNLIIVCKSM